MDFISDFVLGKLKDVIMSVVNWLLKFVIGLLGSMLPALGISSQFMQKIDSAITAVITFVNNASYFIPLDTIVMCYCVMLSIDLFLISFRIVQWIIRLIRG